MKTCENMTLTSLNMISRIFPKLLNDLNEVKTTTTSTSKKLKYIYIIYYMIYFISESLSI